MIAVAFSVACAGAPDDRPRTWAYLHAAIVAPNCATSSCHSALAVTAGIALDDGDDAYATLIERQFVIAGEPGSPLLDLLEGNERRRMPPDSPLPADDVELVRLWIEEGAVR